MNITGSLWMLLISFGVTLLVRYQVLKSGHDEMCEMLNKDFVVRLTPAELEQCKNIYTKSFSFKHWESLMNNWLETWSWSHLSVYAPEETSEIWESTSKSVGIKLKLIENKYLVYDAHKNSKFKRGDIIKKINGISEFTQYEAVHSGGNYLVERQGDELLIKVQKREYIWDDQIRIIGNKIKVLSFRGEFFSLDKLSDFEEKIKKIKSDTVYIDLRDNLGGNVAAGLIFMSYFLCEEQKLGALRVPSKEGMGSTYFPIDIEQRVQVEHLKKYHTIDLITPNNPECLTDKKFIVLVNAYTSSTAEIVAQAFQDLHLGKVHGEHTSGRMVLSSWEPVKKFPEGFYYSFPYALYESISGATIENEGVKPDVYKSYIFDKEKKGIDSFL